jgi:hypothetical protein
MTTTVAEKQGRRIQRIALPLPARVEVKVDRKISWNEVTRLSDISAFGAGFSLKRPVKRGRLVLLTVPMPRQLRCYDYSEAQYRIWGLVRRCLPISIGSGETSYIVGVAFVGKNPPSSYMEDPAKLYDISHREGEGLWHIQETSPSQDEADLPKDLRRQTRFFIPETVSLEIMDENGQVAATETTVTENISLGGAAVFTSMNVEAGAFIRFSSERTNVKIISVVRGARIGHDGMTRLHLEFIDHFFPLEGIE